MNIFKIVISSFFILGVKIFTSTSNIFRLPAISTGRSFKYYRRVFFPGKVESELLTDLADKTIIDIGCGITPYVSDSMFQVCRESGIDFYGVDPKLEAGFQLGTFDKLKMRYVGFNNEGVIDVNPLGLDKALSTTADKLPFDDNSIDLIISSFLVFVWIEDFESLNSVFSESLRVLKPGGRLLVFPVAHQNLTKRRDLQIQDKVPGFRVERRYVDFPPSYINIYTKL